MALAAGNEECTTGLSLRIFQFFMDDPRNAFTTEEHPEPAPASIGFAKALSYAVARAVVAEMVANSDVHNGGVSSGAKVR
jgi:hypothetical protein